MSVAGLAKAKPAGVVGVTGLKRSLRDFRVIDAAQPTEVMDVRGLHALSRHQVGPGDDFERGFRAPAKEWVAGNSREFCRNLADGVCN